MNCEEIEQSQGIKIKTLIGPEAEQWITQNQKEMYNFLRKGFPGMSNELKNEGDILPIKKACLGTADVIGFSIDTLNKTLRSLYLRKEFHIPYGNTTLKGLYGLIAQVDENLRGVGLGKHHLNSIIDKHDSDIYATSSLEPEVIVSTIKTMRDRGYITLYDSILQNDPAKKAKFIAIAKNILQEVFGNNEYLGEKTKNELTGVDDNLIRTKPFGGNLKGNEREKIPEETIKYVEKRLGIDLGLPNMYTDDTLLLVGIKPDKLP